MSAISSAETELNSMLDDGVRINMVDEGQGTYTVHVAVDDQGCADCLVPDATLSAIAADALQRHGFVVAHVGVEHAAVGSTG